MTDPAATDRPDQERDESPDVAPLTTDEDAQHDQNPAADPGTEAS